MKRLSNMSRRSLLQSLGAAAALAPFVPTNIVEAAEVTKRLIIYWTPNGLLYPEYNPKGGVTNFTFGKILAPLAKHRERMLILQNLNFAAFDKYPIENDHDPAYMGLTGARVVRPENSPQLADGPSVDQVVAQKLGRAGSFDGLVVGVKAYSPLFYRKAREKVDPINGAGEIWKTLFSGLVAKPATPEAKDWQALDRKSVIDLVGPQLQALKERVGMDGRRKLDAHLEHLRAIEVRIGMKLPTGGAACTVPERAPTEVSDTPDELERNGAITMELMALALKCDLTRVASFAWFGPGGAANLTYDWLGAGGRHHDLTHAGVVTPDRGEYDSLTKIGAFYARQLAAFVDLLDAVKEGDRSMLDNSVICWTSEHPGNHPRYGDHGRTDVPYLLLGSGGGYFKTGRNIDTQGASNNQLLLSLVHAMGFENETTFGERDLCPGPLAGLT